MPIPKHLRHHYRGKPYEAFRTALLDRAGNACEQCKAPNRQRVFRANKKEFAGWWWSELTGIAHDPRGNPQPHLPTFAILEANPDLTWRGVKIKIGPAHLRPYEPGDLDPSHSKALCQWCHLNYDLPQHVFNSKETRLNRKDSARPLLQVAS